MKKLTIFLLIALILTSLFVSCSSSTSDTAEAISNEKAAEEAKTEITEANVDKAADDLLKELEEEAK